MVYKFIDWKYTCTSRSKQIGVRAGPSEKKRITCQLFVISMLIFDFTVFSLLCFSTRRRTGWLRNYAANTNRRKSGSVISLLQKVVVIAILWQTQPVSSLVYESYFGASAYF